MNGINGLRKLFGLHPMDEAAPAEAPAPAAAPAASAPAADAPAATVEGSSLLSGDKPTDKPAGEGDGEKPAEDAAPEGAPEAYADFTMPEGYQADEEVMGELHSVFKDLNLSQDKAQDLLGKLMAIQEKQLGTPEQQMQAAEQQIVALNSRLAEECRNLPEIGGEKFSQSLATASKVMQTFGTPELRSVIALTGVGSHPEFFKMMVAIGSKMAPDTFEHGGEEAQTTQRGADIMFGHLFKN